MTSLGRNKSLPISKKKRSFNFLSFRKSNKDKKTDDKFSASCKKYSSQTPEPEDGPKERKHHDSIGQYDINNNRSPTINDSLESDRTGYSYKDLGFYSLPGRRSRCPLPADIKQTINTDPFVRAKTLVYRPSAIHNRTLSSPLPPPPLLSPSVARQRSGSSGSDSSDSISSTSQPQLSAALDQIAHRLGMIPRPVTDSWASWKDEVNNEDGEQLSRDPSRLFTKAHSFCAGQQLAEQNRPAATEIRALGITVGSKPPLGPGKPKSDLRRSKEGCGFHHLIGRLSPSLLRRTKSASPMTIRRSPQTGITEDIDADSATGSNEHKNACDPLERCNSVHSTDNPTITSYPETSLDAEESIVATNTASLLTEQKQQHWRLLESVRQDRVLNPGERFRQLAQQRRENKGRAFPGSIEMIGKTTEHATAPISLSGLDTKNKLEPNPSYVSVSVSAFGYGRTSPAYRSPVPSRNLHINGELGTQGD